MNLNAMTAPLLQSKRDALFELACRRARTNLAAYLRWIWPILNPGVTLEWNWHMQQMCDLFQAWIEGDVLRIGVNLPPGVSKTSVNIAASTWELLNYPERRLFCFSHDMNLAWDINKKRRQVMHSERFRVLLSGFGEPGSPDAIPVSGCHIRKGSDNIGEVATILGGWVRAASTKTSVLGGHADAHYYDDPNNAKDLTPAALQAVIRKRKDENASRFRNPNHAREAVIQQHVDVNDLSFSMQMEGLFDPPHGALLVLPQEYDPTCAGEVTIKRSGRPPLVLKDPRTKPGELLFPTRYNREKVESLKANPVVWSLQHQQMPLVLGHQMFKPEWFDGRWIRTTQPDTTMWVGSVDGSGGSKQDDLNYSASYLVIQVWCITSKGRIRLVDQLRMRANPEEHFGAFDVMWRRWRGAPGMRWLIEEKAEGKALIEAYRDNDRYNVTPVVPETRGGTKEQRAQAWVGKASNGWVEVPALDASRPCWLPAEVDPTTVRRLPYCAELDAAKTACLAGRTWDALEALARVDIPRGENPARQRDPDFTHAYRTIEACAISQWSEPQWVEDWLSEVCTFPKAPHDDQVDAASQAIRELWNSIGITPGPEEPSRSTNRPASTRGRRVRARDIKRR